MTETDKQLTVQDRAVVALGMETKATELAELANKSEHLTEITNQDGYDQIHAARMVLRNERIGIEKTGKAARDDANAFSKAVIAEEKRLIGIIEPEELRLKKIQSDHDAKIEAEKQAAIDAETARVEAIQERITEIRGAVAAVHSMGAPTSTTVQGFIDDITAIKVSESVFEEFTDQAGAAKSETLTTLQEARAAAVSREEEEQRIEAERKELAELRELQEKRDAEDRAAREEEQRKASEELERQRKEQVAAQAEIDAENKRLQDERDAFEKEKRETAEREATEEKAEQERKEAAEAAAQRHEFPGENAIIEVLVNHFDVPELTVRSWFVEMRKAA